MKRLAPALVLWILLIPARAQDSGARSPEEEYADRLARVRRNLAEEHYKLGDWLATQQMHAWARVEFNKAVEFNPDHEGSRRRLGYVPMDDGTWEFDPEAKVETQNRKKGDDAVRIRLDYESRFQKLGKKVAKEWYDLGNFCDARKMKDQAIAAWKRAIEYDPGHEGSRKKLGHKRQGKDGPWLTPFEADFRKEMREGIKKAPDGSPHEERTEIEEDMGWNHQKRASPHFLIESSALNQDRLKLEIQHGEHAHAMFHKLFKQEEDLWGSPSNIIVVPNKAAHEAYVHRYHQGSAAHKDLALKSAGIGGYPRRETTLGDRPNIHDYMVHMTAQDLSWGLAGGQRYWLHEGIAYHFTRVMLGTAGTLCVDLAGTSGKGDGKNYQDPEDWPLVIRTWVKEGKDPDINAVFKCRNVAELSGAETVKAWSMVDFLVTEYREKFIEFMTKLRGEREEDDERVLREVFGWNLDDFDDRWRVYARTAY